MHSPFDILKKQPEGSFCRFEGVNDLASANILIKELLALSPGEYVVFDERTNNVIAMGRCRNGLGRRESQSAWPRIQSIGRRFATI